MTPLDFATRYVYFEKSSPISGAFDVTKYPFLRAPLESLDDITIKRHTAYKASSCLGSVFLQIALAYHLDQRPGDAMLVNQSDEDASEWVKTRGKPFLNRITPIRDTLSNDKFAVTNTLWQWPHQFLIITGPGENAQQSKQVRYLYTDESHVKAFLQGDLASFEERTSKRWDRYILHVTTAADVGKEVDGFYYLGKQNEWHYRCLGCDKLFWPLWDDEAEATYNGEHVFHYQLESASMDITCNCPHCGREKKDQARVRYALNEHGDYIAMNPLALPEYESHRWNCFAAHWTPWSEALVKYREAIASARMGNLQPHENFKKKRLCVSYRPELPNLGDKSPFQDYKIGEIWVTAEENKRIGSVDVQDSGGLHFWAQCDNFKRNGDSRRLSYERLTTWNAVREFQLHHNIDSRDFFCDYGHRDREVFGKCAEWKWYALKSTDDSEFTHYRTDSVTKKKLPFTLPFSETQLQDSMSGKAVDRITIVRGVPAGFCLSRLWSKPVIGFLLMRLKSGIAGRYYGIASDISPDYIGQIHSYVEATRKDKKDNTEERFLRKVKDDDHAFTTSSQNLVGAMIAGYFPMDAFKIEVK